ncbi:MAG: biotin transporter BioY [Planctomycetota bacterium]|jgi:biotin transport system substrate-specific component
MNRQAWTSTATATVTGRALSPAARQVAGVLAFAALTAVGARISVPLPGTAVPFTLQPVAVLLAGALLGSRLGAASQLAYLAAGVAGLPVFVAGGGPAYLLGPTGGYLVAFPVAALIAGRFCRAESGVAVWVLGLGAALASIHLGGLAWLSVSAGAERALAVGVTPFLTGDVLKLVLVLVVARGPGRFVRRLLPS